MINNQTILTVVFSESDDPSPQPSELVNILQLLISSSPEEVEQQSELPKLPDLKLNLDSTHNLNTGALK